MARRRLHFTTSRRQSRFPGARLRMRPTYMRSAASNLDELVLVGEPPPSPLTIQSNMRNLMITQLDLWRLANVGRRSF